METAETVKWLEARVSTRLKLSMLWTTIMFFYVYADLIGFFDPKALRQIIDGNLGPFGPITQPMMLGIAIIMSIPTIMIFLSLALKVNQCRWFNIIAGVVYTLVATYTLTMPSSLAYRYFECLEILF